MDATPPSPSRRRFLRGLGAAALVGGSTAGYGHYIGGNELEVDRTTVSPPKWPSSAPPLKIGFLSDFHCDSGAAVERAHRAAEMLLAESPDIVFLGGDYITWTAVPWIGPMAEAIGGLRAARYGAYGVYGNHDVWSKQMPAIRSALAAQQIQVLENQALKLDIPGHPALWLVAVGDVTTRRNYIDQALRGVPPDARCLLLVHEPDYADSVPPVFDLQFSGHSHAGQVCVFGHPIYCPPLGRIYPQGLEQAKNHLVYTTRGVGMMHPQVRIDCPPEVAVLTVKA